MLFGVGMYHQIDGTNDGTYKSKFPCAIKNGRKPLNTGAQAIMSLSDLAIKSAKPKGKAYKLVDGRGLCLLVSSTGVECWRFNYRFDGKQKMLAVGAYPVVTLKDARERCEAGLLF